MASLISLLGLRLDLDLAALALGLTFVAMLVVVSATDLERRIIPNRVLSVAATLALAIIAVGEPETLPVRALCATGAGGTLLAAALAEPEGMGMGDVKLAATMGLFLGPEVLPALLLALVAGAAFGAVLIAVGGTAMRKQAIPFGPFLALGGVVALLTGPSSVAWLLP